MMNKIKRLLYNCVFQFIFIVTYILSIENYPFSATSEVFYYLGLFANFALLILTVCFSFKNMEKASSISCLTTAILNLLLSFYVSIVGLIIGCVFILLTAQLIWTKGIFESLQEKIYDKIRNSKVKDFSIFVCLLAVIIVAGIIIFFSNRSMILIFLAITSQIFQFILSYRSFIRTKKTVNV